MVNNLVSNTSRRIKIGQGLLKPNLRYVGPDWVVQYTVHQAYLTSHKGGIFLRFLSDHLENPEHHPLVMACDTLKPKDIRLSKI